MYMDKIYFQLDEVQNEGKQLGEESKVKTEFSGALRNARVEQLTKKQQESLEFDKLALMSDEICELRKLYGELQSSFQRKDLLLDQISSKFLKSEGGNRDLVSCLNEAFTRIHDLEKKTASASEEMSGLKRLLSIKLQMPKNSMDLDKRDECIIKLEEDSIVSQDQLIWRNEQFSYLLEAHNKLQVLFKESKSEWEKERSSLLNEISLLQPTLDAKVRASDKLEEELRMNKALFDESEQFRSHLQQLPEIENTQAENIRNDVDNKDAKVLDLEHQLLILKSVILARSDAAEVLVQENDNYIRLAENRKAKVRETQELQEEDQNSSSARTCHAANGDLKEAESQITLEVEERNCVLANTEKGINRSHEKVELQDKSSPQPMQVASQPEEAKKLEIQELTNQLEKETRCFDSLLEELKSHKHALLEDRTTEKINRENMLPQLENMCELIGSLCSEDAELMGMLGKLSPLYEEESKPAWDIFSSDLFSASRVPLTELNVSCL